uniref:Uncharacterized protein n=1 Tax=Arion vulgaris TaxID=1028688 RepID=A0A0B7ANA8_9EUPU
MKRHNVFSSKRWSCFQLEKGLRMIVLPSLKQHTSTSKNSFVFTLEKKNYCFKTGKSNLIFPS